MKKKIKCILLNVIALLLIIFGAAFFFGTIVGLMIFGIGWIILGLIMMIIGFWIANRDSANIYFC